MKCLEPLMRVVVLTLGCTRCRSDITMSTRMVTQNRQDHVAMWIAIHYREKHPGIMDDFMHNYLKVMFAQIGLQLP